MSRDHSGHIGTHNGHLYVRFNLNDSISYYLANGVPKEQIVVGMATFGHGWVLQVRTLADGLTSDQTSDYMIMSGRDRERPVLPGSVRHSPRPLHRPGGLPRVLRDHAGPQQRHSVLDARSAEKIEPGCQYHAWSTGAEPHGWTTVTDGCYMAPYIYNGPYWVNSDKLTVFDADARF